MESLSQGIRAGTRSSKPPPSPSGVPTAKDVMATDLVILRPDQTVKEAIALFLKHRISGASVVGPGNTLVGVLSELDCMRVLASAAFDGEPPNGQRRVGELMSTTVTTIEPSTDLYAIVHMFFDRRVRRLPVLVGNQLVGQVSRRDVLQAMSTML